MGPNITLQSGRSPARWFPVGSKLCSRFCKVACSALGLIKLKVSDSTLSALPEIFEDKKVECEQFSGKSIFAVKARCPKALCSLTFVNPDDERTYSGKFQLSARVLLTAMREVGGGSPVQEYSKSDDKVSGRCPPHRAASRRSSGTRHTSKGYYATASARRFSQCMLSDVLWVPRQPVGHYSECSLAEMVGSTRAPSQVASPSLQENQQYVTSLLDELSDHLDTTAVLNDFVKETLGRLLPDDAEIDCLDAVDEEGRMAILVDGRFKPLDDDFPDGQGWSFLEDVEQLRARCDPGNQPSGNAGGASGPTTPAKDAGVTGGSLSFAPAARGGAAPKRALGRNPPPESTSGSGSSSLGSDSSSDDADSAPPPRPKKDSGDAARAVFRVLAKYDVSKDEINHPMKMMRKKGFNKAHALELLGEVATLVVDGNIRSPGAQGRVTLDAAGEGGAGPGAGPGGSGFADSILTVVSKMNDEHRADRAQQQAALLSQQNMILKLAEDSRADQARQQTELMSNLLALTEKHATSVTRVAREMLLLAQQTPALRIAGETPPAW